MAKIFKYIPRSVQNKQTQKNNAIINDSLMELQYRNALSQLQLRIQRDGEAGMIERKFKHKPEDVFGDY